MQPQKPKTLDPRAERLLEWMGAQPWAHLVVLGGGVALKHYLDYRGTKDCDAWWAREATPEERLQVLAAVEAEMLRQNPGCTIRKDSWGDVHSMALKAGVVLQFSFQIAGRSVQLAPYLPSGWGGVRIESLEDNMASKLVAFTDRGVGRDFADVYQFHAGLGWSAADLWALWQRKNPDRTVADAQTNVRVKFEVLLRSRPLENISSPEERARAAAARRWFLEEMLTYEPGH